MELPVELPVLHIASTLGLLLGLSLVAGLVAEVIHLPKVTAYLLVGLFLGPGMLDVVPHEHVHAFDPFLKLAMALVLFDLGRRFPLSKLRRILRRVAVLSLGELLFTFTLVTTGLYFMQQSLAFALLLGALALATAPATTVLVLREVHSEGPVTEYAGILLALNNLASIVVFELVFVGIQLARPDTDSSAWWEVVFLVRNLLGSVLLGFLAGLLVSLGCGLLHSSRWLVLLIAAVTLLLGICETLGLPYMLTFLIMGLVVVNSTEISDKIASELDPFTGILVVLFFPVHGAELDLQAFIAAGAIGTVYILCRLSGKYLGIYFTAKWTHESVGVRQWLGTTLMAQAGAAIALAAIAVQRDPELGKRVQTIILGSVVFFEIVGPVLIRMSAVRAGEVPFSHAIYHSSTTPLEQLRQVWNRLLATLPRSPKKIVPQRELTVADLLRRNVQGIPQSATFNSVVTYIEHSHDNTYPVIDEDSSVVGVIRYPLLSNALCDPSVAQLIRAEDLATPAAVLVCPDDSAAHALELFQNTVDDCIPVVSREAPQRLVGVLRRRDLTHLLIRRHRTVAADQKRSTS